MTRKIVLYVFKHRDLGIKTYYTKNITPSQAKSLTKHLLVADV